MCWTATFPQNLVLILVTVSEKHFYKMATEFPQKNGRPRDNLGCVQYRNVCKRFAKISYL